MRTLPLTTFKLGLFLAFVAALSSFAAIDDRDGPEKQRAAAMYGKLPLSFECNEGQTDAGVRFLARGRGYALFLTRREAVLSLAGQEKQKRAVLRVGLSHANASGADPVGADALDGKSNYFTGKDPNRWHTGISHYAAVKYTGVYPGIDLVYHGNQGQLEYDFNVAPGADPRRIELQFKGARQLRVNKAGDLVVSLSGSELVEHGPVVYQETEGKRELVAGSYVLRGRDRVGFRLAGYDRNRAVIIDPTLVYATFLGGSSNDEPYSIAVDIAGNAYVTGCTQSTDFPVTSGAVQTKFGGGPDNNNFDVFVAKLNTAGSALVYSTYLGGGGYEVGQGIAVDAAGNAYVTGWTFSTEFPVTPGAFQTSNDSTLFTAFIAKINAAGSALVYSTYLGGSGGDQGNAVAIDAAGNAYITGATDSLEFPVTPGAFKTQPSGSETSFITKFNATGSATLYSTFLGDGYGYGIAIDAGGNAFVTGSAGANFPVTPGAFQTSVRGYEDAFVTKVNAAGSALLYSTFLGGSVYEQGSSITIDSAGDAYVTGLTTSADFPVTPGAFQTIYGGLQDAFITKLDTTGSTLLYSTLLGGDRDTYAAGIAVDANGNTYVTGGTRSANFPVTPNAFQPTFNNNGNSDGFLSKLNASGSALLYSTFLSGGGFDSGVGVAVDATGNAYYIGLTESADFPVTSGAFQTTFGGYDDAFVAKLNTTAIGPVISLVGVFPGPPKRVQFSSQDQQPGLATVLVLKCLNCTAVTDTFTPGTKDRVMTIATKTDQTMSSSVQIKAADLAGNTSFFDPTDITIQADGHAEIQLVRISGLEHIVMITNSTPGVCAIVLRVYGKDVPVPSLKDGEARTIDIATELKAGRNNEVTVLSWGPRGAGASLVFTQP